MFLLKNKFAKIFIYLVCIAVNQSVLADIDVPFEFPSKGKKTEVRSNGKIKYFYYNGILKDGYLSFSDDTGTSYLLNLKFENNRLKELSASTAVFNTYSNPFGLKLTCEEIFKKTNKCNTHKIFKRDGFFNKYSELKKVPPIDGAALWSERIRKREEREKLNIEITAYENVIESLKYELKENNFSDDFIRNVSIAALKKQ